MAQKAKSKAVATTKSSGPAAVARAGANLPAFMQGLAGQGTELMRQEDVEIPRLALLQALSDPVQNGDERAGNFWHTVAEVNLGDSLSITPVFITTGFILWRPRKDGGGILARADDGIHWNPADTEFEVKLDNGRKVKWRTAKTVAASRLDQWGTSDPTDQGSPPAATRMFLVAAILRDHPEYSPVVVTLQRSAIKVGKKLAGKLMLSQAPSYGTRYTMTSYRDQNNVGQEFYNWRFTADGLITDEQEFHAARQMYEHFKQMGIKVRDMEGAQDDAGPEPPDGDGEKKEY